MPVISSKKKLVVRSVHCIMLNELPPQSGIVLAFENPPDPVRAVYGLIDKVPANFEDCAVRR